MKNEKKYFIFLMILFLLIPTFVNASNTSTVIPWNFIYVIISLFTFWGICYYIYVYFLRKYISIQDSDLSNNFTHDELLIARFLIDDAQNMSKAALEHRRQYHV